MLPIHYKLSTINSIMANANANAKQAYGKGLLFRLSVANVVKIICCYTSVFKNFIT